MVEYFKRAGTTLHFGDCREVMATLDADSIDSIVTDAPYGLSFMGRAWDHAVPGVEFWAEALRVAKPGAHLLAFGGTRLYHRLTCAIEDAGWEIRDCLSWLYGSGFPKSLDVSKALDKYADPADILDPEEDEHALQFTSWLRSTGIKRQQIDDVTGTTMASHYLSSKSQPAIPTREHWERIRPLIRCEIPAWVDRAHERAAERAANLARRPVLGHRVAVDTSRQAIACALAAQGLDETTKRTIPITSAHTEAARQWSGWGTALKPAWEPIILARKPLRGTVAANVLAFGTGAINVDACRLDGVPQPALGVRERVTYGFGTGEGRNGEMSEASGRWPANVALDEDAAALLDEQSGEGESKANPNPNPNPNYANEVYGRGMGGTISVGNQHSDFGGASRFFYTAKASRSEREAGLREAGLREARVSASVHGDMGDEKNPNHPRRNSHPTVKPVDLMRWLVRLVTRPGGTVLDPFMGSGSTGVAAFEECCKFVGIERELEYLEIAKGRLSHSLRSPLLFTEVSA